MGIKDETGEEGLRGMKPRSWRGSPPSSIRRPAGLSVYLPSGVTFYGVPYPIYSPPSTLNHPPSDASDFPAAVQSLLIAATAANKLSFSFSFTPPPASSGPARWGAVSHRNLVQLIPANLTSTDTLVHAPGYHGT